jgi:hypothetical protein
VVGYHGTDETSRLEIIMNKRQIKIAASGLLDEMFEELFDSRMTDELNCSDEDWSMEDVERLEAALVAARDAAYKALRSHKVS